MSDFFKKFGNKKYSSKGKVISGDKKREEERERRLEETESSGDKMIREANEASASRAKKKKDQDDEANKPWFKDGGVVKKKGSYSKLKKFLKKDK